MKYIVGFFAIAFAATFVLKFFSQDEIAQVYEARLKLFLERYEQHPEETLSALNEASKICTEEKVGPAPEEVFPVLSQIVLARAAYRDLSGEDFGKAVAARVLPYLDEAEDLMKSYSDEDQRRAGRAVEFWQQDPVALVACQNAKLRDLNFFQ